jgi:hypothetical protein
MPKSNIVIPKKTRGRPATGKNPLTALRFPPSALKAVEHWAKKQDDTPNRSEAIRRLVELGLKVKKWDAAAQAMDTWWRYAPAVTYRTGQTLAVHSSKAEPVTHRSCGPREKVRAEGEVEMMLMIWAIAIIVLGVAVLIIKRNVRKYDVLHGTFIEDVNQ